MAIKALIFSSAAALLASGKSQAVDLPVEASPLDDTRVCSVHGAGSVSLSLTKNIQPSVPVYVDGSNSHHRWPSGIARHGWMMRVIACADLQAAVGAVVRCTKNTAARKLRDVTDLSLIKTNFGVLA